MPFVLFRCDGGPDIGMGHIMRCRALDFAFDERGWERGFAVSQATAEWVKDLNPYVVPDGLEGAEAVKKIVRERNAMCVVIDHYGLDAEFERQVAAPGIVVVAIDDMPGRQHAVDTLVDSNPARVPADYVRHTTPGTRFLLRTRFAMIRPEFMKTRERGFRRLRDKPRKLLIALGGSDPNNVSARVIEGAPAFQTAGLSTTLVVGRMNPHRESLAERCSQLGIKMVCNPQNLVALMAGADIAISNSGTTCYEFACLGVPMVALMIVDNQRDMGRAIASVGAAEIVDCIAGFELQPIIEAVTRITADKLLRERISAAAQAMVTGEGARDFVHETLRDVKRKQERQ